MAALHHNGENQQRSSVNDDQLDVVISYAEDHPDFATSRIPRLGARVYEKYKQMWWKVADMANKRGPCQKTGEQWKEYWCSRRKTARANFYKYVKAWCETGHTKPSFVLAPQDERISRIFGKPGLALAIVPELGVSFRSKLPNKIQKFFMAKFMLAHLDFARNLKNENDWLKLELIMHSLGPVQTRQTWYQVWAQLIRDSNQHRYREDYHLMVLRVLAALRSLR